MKKIGLDATDIRILTAVQQHGALSKSKLAALVNISPTPAWARLRRLQSAGLITGYHAEIALAQIMVLTQVVVTVGLTHHRKADFERFETFVTSQDEIVDCIATGGGTDYVMKVICPSLSAFQDLMETMLAADLAIDRYMTYIVTRSVKTARPNLAKLLARQSLSDALAKVSD